MDEMDFRAEHKNLTEKIVKLKTKLHTLEIQLKRMEHKVGSAQLHMIYSSKMRPSLFSKERENQKILKLYEFEYEDKKYALILDFIMDYGVGESYTIDQFEGKLAPEIFDEMMETIYSSEDALLQNAIEMYENLNPVRRKTHKELERLIPNKSRKYSYSFRGKNNKQFILGFMVVYN